MGRTIYDGRNVSNGGNWLRIHCEKESVGRAMVNCTWIMS